MKRVGLTVALTVAMVAAWTPAAQAQHSSTTGHGHGHGHAATPAPPPEPTGPNANIVALMNGMSWGMTRDQLIDAVKLEIKNKYWPQIQAVADDGVAEQNLRTRMEAEQQRVVDSCVKFDGQATPWNVSMIDTEFTHNNQEEMCRFDRGDTTDFFFFIRGKLWKIFRTLNQAVGSAAVTFDDMRAQMEGQFGPGEEVRDVNHYTLVSQVAAIKWIDSQTELQLRWLDLYGVLAVVLAERATLTALPTLRRATATATTPGDEQPSGLTDAVTSGTATDENSDVVQRLRGTRPDPNAPQTPAQP